MKRALLIAVLEVSAGAVGGYFFRDQQDSVTYALPKSEWVCTDGQWQHYPEGNGWDCLVYENRRSARSSPIDKQAFSPPLKVPK